MEVENMKMNKIILLAAVLIVGGLILGTNLVISQCDPATQECESGILDIVLNNNALLYSIDNKMEIEQREYYDPILVAGNGMAWEKYIIDTQEELQMDRDDVINMMAEGETEVVVIKPTDQQGNTINNKGLICVLNFEALEMYGRELSCVRIIVPEVTVPTGPGGGATQGWSLQHSGDSPGNPNHDTYSTYKHYNFWGNVDNYAICYDGTSPSGSGSDCLIASWD